MSRNLSAKSETYRSESSGLESGLGITTDRSDLLSKVESDSLVKSSCIRRSRILVLQSRQNQDQLGPLVHTMIRRQLRKEVYLGNTSDLRVDSLDLDAGYTSLSNSSRVPLESSVNESSRHSDDVSSGFGVGESLIGGCLLHASRIDS